MKTGTGNSVSVMASVTCVEALSSGGSPYALAVCVAVSVIT